jgi:hypothetical protein
MPDARIARLAELKAQLQALSEEGRTTAPGSPERVAVLERWGPIHAAVLALADELSGELGVIHLHVVNSEIERRSSYPPRIRPWQARITLG